MTLARPRAQEIGTSYRGKEEPDAFEDVLRTVLRRGGQPCGFEPCLTSRPFTAVTMDEARPGLFRFGRGDLAADLGDALALLGELGWSAEPVRADDPDALRDGAATVLVGPLAVSERWSLPEARLADAACDRYLLVDARIGTDLLRCFDPVFGGFMTCATSELPAEAIVVRRRARAARPEALARAAWLAGGRRRRTAAAPTRDGPGLRALAARPGDWSSGAAAFRLRHGLRQMGLRRHQLACLLGHADDPGPRAFVTADLLYAGVVTCREAVAASLRGGHERLCECLRALADLEESLTMLTAE